VCMYLCDRHIPDHILHQQDKFAKLPALRLLRPFFDQWLGSGISGPEVCDDGLESAATEDEPHLSSPARRRTVRRKGSIVRGVSREPGNDTSRSMELQHSRTDMTPRRSVSRGPATVGREGTSGEPSRARSGNSAEADQASPGKQPFWLGGYDSARRRSGRDLSVSVSG
jgi:hypothetical protein